MTKRPAGSPGAIRIARQRHYCDSCDGVIEKGDKMTMQINSGHHSLCICLKCDGREWVRAEAQDNPTLKERGDIGGEVDKQPFSLQRRGASPLFEGAKPLQLTWFARERGDTYRK